MINDPAKFLARQRSLLRQQSKALVRSLDSFQAASPEASPFREDIAYLSASHHRIIRARREIHAYGWRYAALAAFNTRDQMLAMTDVLSEASPRVFTHLILARSCIESAARVHYLLDARLSTQERVLRAAAIVRGGLEEETRAISRYLDKKPIGTSVMRREFETKQRRFRDLLTRAHIVDYSPGGRLRGVEDQDSPTSRAHQPNITAILDEVLPEKVSAYRLTSGAVHVQPWVLDDSNAVDAATGRINWTLDLLSAAGSTDLAIAAARVVIKEFGAYYGVDAQAEILAAKERGRQTTAT